MTSSSMQNCHSPRKSQKSLYLMLKMSQVELYDDSIDPFDYLEGYHILMGMQIAFDALLCLTFLATF